MPHSKLPWTINSYGQVIDSSGEIIVLTGFALMGSASYKKEAEDKRGLIITAVNVMPEVISVLRCVIDKVIDNPLRVATFEDRCEKLLEKLEGVDG